MKKLIEDNQAAIKDIIDNKLTKLESDYQAAVKALEDGAVKDNADAIKNLIDVDLKNIIPILIFLQKTSITLSQVLSFRMSSWRLFRLRCSLM